MFRCFLWRDFFFGQRYQRYERASVEPIDMLLSNNAKEYELMEMAQPQPLNGITTFTGDDGDDEKGTSVPPSQPVNSLGKKQLQACGWVRSRELRSLTFHATDKNGEMQVTRPITSLKFLIDPRMTHVVPLSSQICCHLWLEGGKLGRPVSATDLRVRERKMEERQKERMKGTIYKLLSIDWTKQLKVPWLNFWLIDC